MSTDCTPRYCYADPYEGGKQAVAETYRNICAVGAKPLAITNCLNFANPQRPEIMAQIVGCLEGMGDACRALDYPIVSGNVSLYNESKATGGGSAILPTPAIGGVGVLEEVGKMATIGFKAEGDAILVIGGDEDESLYRNELGQSLWLREVHGLEAGSPPTVDLELERKTGEFIRQLIQNGRVTAVHDISDGGTAVAVAEMALASGLGAQLKISSDNLVEDTLSYFAENQGRYIVTTSSEFAEAIGIDAFAKGLQCVNIGRVSSDKIDFLAVSDSDERIMSTLLLSDLRAVHESFFKNWMEA
jgi:phosphoribosylformylglycinamidine synthase subunit PurL